MIYPSDRYPASSARGYLDHRRGRRWPYIALVIVVVVAAILTSLTIADGRLPLSLGSVADDGNWVALWEGGKYDTLIEETTAALARSPMNGNALVFNGFAHFYSGIDRVSPEESEDEFLDATVALRRALLLHEPPLVGRVHYVLGKTYYHRGTFYYDLAASHLQQALNAGFVGSDSYKYLGLAEARLGNSEASSEAFEKAIQQEPSALLYLTAAESYRQSGQTSRAEHNLIEAIASATDDFLEQQARSRLGDLYLSQNQFEAAREQFEQIIDDNPRSADAHYWLGVAFSGMGNRERARFEWREARRIDPNHSEALSRLQNN